MHDDISSLLPNSSSSYQPLYREERNSLGITLILGLVTLLMTMFLVAQLIYGPLGTKPAPTWFLAALTMLFALLTVNFRHVTLTLMQDKVEVRYGIFGASRRWEDVVACEEDEKNYFYGWGIRLGRYKHHWVWVYNVIGGPRVVFLTGRSKPKGLIVSTAHPDEVISISNTRIQAVRSRGDTP